MNIRRYYGTIHFSKFLIRVIPRLIEYAYNEKIFYLGLNLSHSIQSLEAWIAPDHVDAHSKAEWSSFRLVTDARL